MHSLLLMRLAAAVFDKFGIRLPVRTFFQHTTIKSLADHMTAEKSAAIKNHKSTIL
jgi:acyl carrier protein